MGTGERPKDGDDELPDQHHEGGEEKNGLRVAVIEDAEGDDEKDGNSAGDRIKEVELGNIDGVELLDFSL